jgi:hypothetical protein
VARSDLGGRILELAQRPDHPACDPESDQRHACENDPRDRRQRQPVARNWRRLHYLTFAVFGAATVHGLAAGTDRWALPLYAASIASLIGLTAWRVCSISRCSATCSPGTTGWEG